MPLYSGKAEVLVAGEPVCQVTTTLDGDPTDDWGGPVHGLPGQDDPPEQISKADQWVLRLPDGKEATVTSRGSIMQTGDGVIYTYWRTDVRGIGDFPT